MGGRGGKQRIPRPAEHRPGGPAPWAALDPEQRRFTVDEVVDRLRALPAPLPSELAAPDQVEAAVLLPLVDLDGEAGLVLTKRPETMPSHRGEIAFPGGKREPWDLDLRAAALREAEEEIALAPGDVRIVAELDTISTVASSFSITPFVGVVRGEAQLRAHPLEVVAVLSATFTDLLAPETFRSEEWRLWGEWRTMYFFDLPGETVWGATARILGRLLEFLAAGRSLRGSGR
ncbi:MAG TPA: CoA pyrophosphatase [Acidimicrobiia bacterium]